MDTITDRGIGALAKLGKLRHLNLRFCRNLTDDGIASLPAGIEDLILFGCTMQGHGLGRFGRLRRLVLNSCKRTDPQTIEAIAAGKSRSTLQDLDLSCCPNFQAEDLARIASLPALRKLNLRFCHWFADGDLAQLAPMRGRLEWLDLSLNNELSGEALKHLYGFEKLRQLNLAGAGIKPGFEYGVTDDHCYNIVENPVHIRDLNATILHQLGIDHERFTFPYLGLDERLTGVEHARVVRDILV